MTDATIDTQEILGRIVRTKAKARAAKAGLVGYGFALVAGTLGDEDVIYVVTESGERVVLTRRLLKALERMTICLAGSVVCALEENRMRFSPDEPVPAILLTMAPAPDFADPIDFVDLDLVLDPRLSMGSTRYTFTAPRRPAGWPT